MSETLTKLIFLEESTLTDGAYITFIKKLIKDSKNSKILFLCDESLKKPRTQIIRQQTKEAYRMDGILDILEDMNLVEFIATQNYFDFFKVFEFVETSRPAKVLFFTERESVALTIKNEFETRQLDLEKYSLFHLEWGQTQEWVIKEKVVENAFYVDKDKYIINNFDNDKINVVYSPKYRYLTLDKTKPLEGGEGKIFPTTNGMLVKIFDKTHITYNNYKKLQRLLEIDVFDPHINWPKSIVFVGDCPLGYCMDKIEGTIGLDELRMSGFEGFSEKERYELVLHLLERIAYIHSLGIVIGDLKPDNILVSNKTEVYIIDCGSFQIDDYPCVVFHPHYTKTKYTELELTKHLRTQDDEYYAINKIIFEILVGRTPNYDPSNPSVDAESKTFLYPLDVTNIDSTNKRNDLRRWAMMSQKMREMFYHYFVAEKISYLNEWIGELKSVLNY